jgi:hypothetical protein
VAQQQHYNRIALSGNGNATAGNPAQGSSSGAGMTAETGGLAAGAAMDGGISEENRKVFIWVAELLDPSRREAALMELSKKREQVPELALVIWHSFGMTIALFLPGDDDLTTHLCSLILFNRCYDGFTPRNYFCLSVIKSLSADSCGLEPSLQCSRFAAVRSFSQ